MKITPASLKALSDGDLDNFIAASTPGGIEAQEAAGQKSFVRSQTLPKDCPQEQLEALGFVFCDDADDIFVNVQFPEGWEIKPTDHSMHNDLIDGSGRKRGGIFYKAAFYDRHASLRLNNRYTCSQNYELKDAIQYQILDCGEIIFSTPAEDVSDLEPYKADWSLIDSKHENEVIAKLKADYPNHSDTGAYWAD